MSAGMITSPANVYAIQEENARLKQDIADRQRKLLNLQAARSKELGGAGIAVRLPPCDPD